ncbi:UDP-glucose 4-epimerase GalE [Streptomyces spiroverticillatus]
MAVAGPTKVVSLRYFNPIGADPQLRTGLQLRKPSHALGAMIDTHRSGGTFHITGTDWPTRDGSGVRDYVHVWDLALAHVAALRRFDTVTASDPYRVINLGTGNGTTVRELVTAFEQVTGEPLNVAEAGPRPGDTAGAYTSSTRAYDLLGWKPTLSVEEGIRDSLRWVEKRDEVLGEG